VKAETLVQLAEPDHRVEPELLDLPELGESMVLLELLDQPDRLDLMACKDFKALLAQLELLVLPGLLVPLDFRVRQGFLVLLGRKETLVVRAEPERLDLRDR